MENIRDRHEAGLMTLAIPWELGGTDADLITTPRGVRELVGKHLFGVPPDVQPRWG